MKLLLIFFWQRMFNTVMLLPSKKIVIEDTQIVSPT